MELLFIRHAMTAGNLAKKYIGRTDEPLCPEGMGLARKAAVRFPSPDRLYISPMLRCRETAKLLFPHLAPVVIDDLRETDFGEFEGKSYDELKDNSAYREWLDSGCTGPIPGGESRDEATERVLNGFNTALVDLMLQDYTHRAAFVVHGGTIMSIMAAMALPERDYYGWQVANCGGFLVTPENDRLRLIKSY